MQITAAIQNANLYNRTRRLSITDPITRLYNHRYFLQYLDSELQRFQRYGTPFSLIMADIDHFKMFNDKYGHKVGDDVLYRVAEMLKLGAREIDIVARYGGEEFAIVMPSTGISGARRMAERIRKSLDGKKFTVGKYKLGVTISMGVSEIYPKMSNTELIESADQALYAAKDGGRNCVFYMDRNRCPVKIKTTGKKR
jgi:diguanylate cyclase (GGDEF)-like protein